MATWATISLTRRESSWAGKKLKETGRGISLKMLKKTTKNLIEYGRSMGRDLNPGTLEYIERVLYTEAQYSALHFLFIRIIFWKCKN
jgi:hypothetical protein